MANEEQENQAQAQEQAAADAAARAVQEARQSAEALLEELSRLELTASRAQQRMDEKASDRETGRDPRALDAPIVDKSQRIDFATTQGHVKAIITAFKHDPSLRPPEGTTGGRIINAIVDNIKNPDSDINDKNAPYIHKILRRAIDPALTNPLEALNSQEFKHLQTIDQSLAQKVGDALKTAARESGITQIQEFEERLQQDAREGESNGEETQEEMLRRMAEAENDPRQVRMRERGNFDQIWSAYYEPFLSPTDKDIVESIYNPQIFKAKMVDQTWQDEEKKYRAAHNKGSVELTEGEVESINKRVSKNIELEIALTISKLFRIVDRKDPQNDFMQEISIGGYYSPLTAYNNLTGKIAELADHFERNPDTAIVSETDKKTCKMQFYKRYIQETQEERTYKAKKDSNGNREGKKIIARKNRPDTRGGTLSEFLNGVNVEVGHEFKWREYTHNIALAFKSANVDERSGYWSRLAAYADQIGSTDIDNIANLPDSDLFMKAYRLYIRYLEEDFAINNWIHQPDTFSKKEDRWSSIQAKVMRSLREVNKKEESADGSPDQHEWQVQRAMSIATGLARGVFLPEVEMAAWADPNLTEEGGKTFKRYYTNDNVALNALNPMHHIFRFQLTGTQHYPIMYWPVSETNPKFIFNHKEEWEKGKKFFNSFLTGTQHLKEKGHEDERSLMELLPNFSHGAGIFSRPGWRLRPSYEQWVVYKKDKYEELKTNNVDLLATWMGIENIGFQVLYDFVVGDINEEGLEKRVIKEPKPNQEPKENQREFYEYVYEKYGDKDRDLEEAESHYTSIAENSVDDFIKKGIINKFERDKMVEKEISRLILHEVLAGVLRQRMPTKFLLLERDRTVRDGKRPWEKIRKEMQNTGVEKVEDFNKLVDRLIQVETQIRDDTTQKMLAHLESSPEGTLSDFATEDYEVTGPRIREILKGVDEVEVDNVVILYDKIMRLKDHTDDKDKGILEIWGDKLRWTDAKGHMIRARYFPFAVAQEETEVRFLSFINSGEKMLRNTLSETATGEEGFNAMKDWVNALKDAATDGKQDFGPIIEAINKVKGAVGMIEDSNYGAKWAFYMAQATVAFFRRDSFSKIAGLNVAGAGQVHSMAGEVVGPFRSAWQWTTEEQLDFYYQLEKLGVLPKTAQTFKDVDQFETLDRNNPILKAVGKAVGFDTKINVPFINKEVHLKWQPDKVTIKKRHTSYTSDQARRLSGSTGKEMFFEGLNKYLPLFLIFMLYTYISKALKETTGDRKN